MSLLVLQVGVGLDGHAGVHRALKWAAVGAQHATAGIDVAKPATAAVTTHHLATQKARDSLGAAVPQQNALLAIHEVHAVLDLVENTVIHGRVEREAQSRLKEGQGGQGYRAVDDKGRDKGRRRGWFAGCHG